jgi:membrane-bound lytic murein transglycosylase MltF
MLLLHLAGGPHMVAVSAAAVRAVAILAAPVGVQSRNDLAFVRQGVPTTVDVSCQVVPRSARNRIPQFCEPRRG